MMGEYNEKSTYRLLSFRLSKYSTVKLDFVPTTIEYVDPFFLLAYGGSPLSSQQLTYDCIPYIDIFEKTGEPVKRINISSILKQHGLSFQNVTHIVIPKLRWSLR